MAHITAKQLKQNTGQIIKRVRAGEKLTITYRGKPVAIISPATTQGHRLPEKLRPFSEAWKDIVETLRRSEARFKGWKEATDCSSNTFSPVRC